MSKIEHVEFIPIVGPIQDSADLDGSVETILIRITDDEGRFGIGETDAPAHVIKSYFEMSTAHVWSQNLPELLIGADAAGTCQLLNGYDLVGPFETFKPKFAKRHGNIAEVATKAFEDFAKDVRCGTFPDVDHSYKMKPEEAEKLTTLLADEA